MWSEIVALLAEGVDRNKRCVASIKGLLESPSSRRAWIEISPVPCRWPEKWVALLAEGVDRNNKGAEERCPLRVALLAEGVDRNDPPRDTLKDARRRPPRGGRG